MHWLFSGILQSAETTPIEGEIFSDRERVFICHYLFCLSKQIFYLINASKGIILKNQFYINLSRMVKWLNLLYPLVRPRRFIVR